MTMAKDGPSAHSTFEAFRDADRWYRDYRRASERACAARGALAPGASRARVTSANARWSRAAEARDRREQELRALWDQTHPDITQGNVTHAHPR